MDDEYYDTSDEIGTEQMLEMAERECWANLGITFKEFRTRWFKGEYRNDPRPEVTDVAFWITGEYDCE